MDKLVSLNRFNYDIKDNKLSVFSETKEFNLTGPSVNEILSVLKHCNGSFTKNEIYKKLDLKEEYFNQIINFLIEKNIIKISSRGNNDLVSYLLNNTLIDEEEIIKERNFLKNKKIRLIGDSDLVNLINSELNRYFHSEIVTDNPQENYDQEPLYILVFSYENIKKIKDFLIRAKEKNLTFLRVVIDEVSLRLGPIYVPNETVCYSCYLSRLVSNKEYPKIFIKYNSSELFSTDINNFSDEHLIISSKYLIKHLIKATSNYLDSELYEKEIFYNFFEDVIVFNKVLTLPNCQYCG